MKSLIYLISFFLVFCVSCKNIKETGALKETKGITLAGTTWVDKKYSEGIYREAEIKFTDSKNGTMTFRNSTRMPDSQPITYKQDGFDVTIYNKKSQKIFKVKIKSDNVLTLTIIENESHISQFTKVESIK